MPTLISVIGPNADACTPEIYDFGLQLGERLTNEGFWIVCGGKQGLMEAVCRGAHQSKHYTFGCTLGILPESHGGLANPYCDLVIPTGLGIARNFLVVNTGEKVVAVAGGSGTLSEIAFAWQLGKPIVAFTGFDGWARNLAGQPVDSRSQNAIQEADNLERIIQLLKS